MVRSIAEDLPEQVKNKQSVNLAAGNGGQKMSQYSWFTVYAETGGRKRPCKADSVLWRPLLLGGYQNMCRQGNLQRGTKKSRTYKLS